MLNHKRYYNYLQKNPLQHIIDKAPIYVKYLAARKFLYKDYKLIEELNLELQKYKPLQKLLSSQDNDGVWNIDQEYKVAERTKSMTFLNQIINLKALLDYSCNKGYPEVQKGLIALLKSQKSDGKFPLHLHHQGFTLLLLEQYGLQGNPFVEKGFRWISRKQRSDGGWLSSAMIPENQNIKSTKSDIWTTLIILHAFSKHTRLNTSENCKKAIDFVLKNYFLQSTTTFFPEPNAWSHFSSDYSTTGIFRGGTLKFLEVLAPFGNIHKHPNFKKALNWLISTQLSSGLFPAIAGKSKEGDYMVTFRVLAVLDEIAKSN